MSEHHHNNLGSLNVIKEELAKMKTLEGRTVYFEDAAPILFNAIVGALMASEIQEYRLRDIERRMNLRTANP